jgi:hypothetical protein
MKQLCNVVRMLAVITLLVFTCFAQNPATQGSASGRYGLSAWAINNQRVASLFNYDIDSQFGGNAIAGGTYSFPLNTCTQALSFGGGRNVNPFNSNATIKIVDITSANTETVSGVTPTYAGAICTLPVAPSNAHSAFHLRSGTCGLKEAQNDKGTAAGTIIVDQKFYDDGCSASTITALVGGVAGDVVLDISSGKYDFYTWSGSAFVLTSSTAGNSVLSTGSVTPTATSAAIQTVAQTFTVTGLVSGADIVVVSEPAPTSLCPLVEARATGANTVSLYFSVLTAAACTPAAGTYKVMVTP